MRIWSVKQDLQLRVSMSNVHYSKTRWISEITIRLQRSEQSDKEEYSKKAPITKDSRYATELEGFKYATSLDFNMGYYHMILTPFARRFCNIVLTWGKYKYCCLPMGISVSPEIFQEKMSELMSGLEFARAYLDDLLVTRTSLDQIVQSRVKNQCNEKFLS